MHAEDGQLWPTRGGERNDRSLLHRSFHSATRKTRAGVPRISCTSWYPRPPCRHAQNFDERLSKPWQALDCVSQKFDTRHKTEREARYVSAPGRPSLHFWMDVELSVPAKWCTCVLVCNSPACSEQDLESFSARADIAKYEAASLCASTRPLKAVCIRWHCEHHRRIFTTRHSVRSSSWNYSDMRAYSTLSICRVDPANLQMTFMATSTCWRPSSTSTWWGHTSHA